MHCRICNAHCPKAPRHWIAGVPFLGSDRLLGRTPHPPRLVGPRIAGVPLPTAWGRCGSALQELHCPLPPGSEYHEVVYCRSCTAHCPQAVQYTALLPTACGQWGLELVLCTATLPGGTEPCNSCNTLPHCPGSTGGATPAMHCHTAWGQWAVQLLQCTATRQCGSA